MRYHLGIQQSALSFVNCPKYNYENMVSGALWLGLERVDIWACMVPQWSPCSHFHFATYFQSIRPQSSNQLLLPHSSGGSPWLTKIAYSSLCILLEFPFPSTIFSLVLLMHCMLLSPYKAGITTHLLLPSKNSHMYNTFGLPGLAAVSSTLETHFTYDH
jgi:hypothetical protein